MGKAITLGLVLGAKLAPGFGAVFKTAREQAQGLKTTLANARVGSSAAADVARLGARLDRLRASQATLGTDNVKLASRIKQTQQALNRAAETASRYGVTMDNAAAKQRHFGAAADQAARSLARLRAAEQRKAVRQEAQGQILGTVGLAAPLVLATREAIKFESVMADVRKVVNFDTPQQFDQMGRDILNLSTKIPMPAEGLAKIMASAGQSGIARNELLGFTETAAKMGIAFDISSEQAGSMMANWRAGLGLSQPRVVALADATNYLSNNMNATAAAIGEVIQRQGAVAMAAGLSEQKVAALSAALLSSGAGPEVASTGLKNFTNALTKGFAATKSQKAAFSMLGLSSKKLALGMQKDAEGTILTVLERLAKAPKHMQSALVSQAFGEESKGAIMPLLANLDNLRQAFGLVADASKTAGSMEQEFKQRSDTTGNKIQLLGNTVAKAATTIGTILLPAVGAAADKLGAVLSVVSDLAQRYPALTTAVTFAAVGLVGFKVASLAARFGGTLLLDGVSLLVGAFNFFRPSVLAANASLVWHKALALGSAAAHGVWQGALLVGRGAMLAFAGAMKVVTAAQWLWNAALTANPIGLIITAVAALGAAAYVIYENWEPIKAWFKGLWDTVGNLCSAAMAQIKSLVAAPLDYLEAKANKLLALVGLGKKNEAVAAAPATTALGKSVSAHGAPAVNGTQVVAASHGQNASVPATAAPTFPAPAATHGTSAFPARQGATPPAASAAATAIAPALSAPQGAMPSSQASTTQAPGMSATRQLEAELARLTAATKQATTDTPSPGKPGSEGKRLPPVTMHNTVNVTFTGMESVENAIKKALEAFSREMEGRIAAIRDQQARLSFGG